MKKNSKDVVFFTSVHITHKCSRYSYPYPHQHHISQTISLVSFDRLDLIFRTVHPPPLFEPNHAKLQHRTVLCGTKHFYKSAFIITIYDLIGALFLLPCGHCLLLHSIFSSYFSFFASVLAAYGQNLRYIICITPLFLFFATATPTTHHPTIRIATPCHPKIKSTPHQCYHISA